MIDERNYPWLCIVNIPTILSRKNTYLHLAAKTGQTKAFKTARNEEEDKTIKNELGETFFHLVCKNGRLNIVHLLLKNIAMTDNYDINLNTKTKKGNTAFHKACELGH